MVEAATHAGEGASWDVRWDGADGVPGFGVRVYPSGRKSYLVIYRVGGRRRTYTIGSTSRIALEAARDRAKRIALEASDGFDPLAERRRSRGVGTFGELCDVYVEEYAKPLKATWKEDERRIEKHVRSALGSKAAGAITADDVRYLHREITRRSPIEANPPKTPQAACCSTASSGVCGGFDRRRCGDWRQRFRTRRTSTFARRSGSPS
jgi:hypothetical protein